MYTSIRYNTASDAVCNVYNTSSRVVLNIQSRAEGERLYIQYNTAASVVNILWNEYIVNFKI